jgi:hypothetical protein
MNRPKLQDKSFAAGKAAKNTNYSHLSEQKYPNGKIRSPNNASKIPNCTNTKKNISDQVITITEYINPML